MTFKDLMFEIMIRCDCNQRELAYAAGLAPDQLSRYKRGQMPTLMTLQRIIRVANEKAKMNVTYKDIEDVIL